MKSTKVQKYKRRDHATTTTTTYSSQCRSDTGFLVCLSRHRHRLPFDIMRILSIDVGIRNLSFVDVSARKQQEDEDEKKKETEGQDEKGATEGGMGKGGAVVNGKKRGGGRYDLGNRKGATATTTWSVDVIDWGVIDFTEGYADPAKMVRDPDRLSQSILDKLNERFFEDRHSEAPYDYVIIENQPVVKNPTMKTIQVVIFTFFQSVRMFFGGIENVRFVSAAAKLEAVIAEGAARTTSYKDKKKAAVAACKGLLDASRDGAKVCCHAVGRVMLSSFVLDNELRRVFETTKKKDDMSDALLQCIAFLGRLGGPAPAYRRPSNDQGAPRPE